MQKMTCCFIGHREIEETEQLREKLYQEIENLILNKDADTFLFGSKGRFNDLSHEVVSALKEKYPHIKRIYVRAEFPYISEDYKTYLLEGYEDTYYPRRLVGAGRSVYVQRNCLMIDRSDYCLIYYREDLLPDKRKSGASVALQYAKQKKKVIIQLP